MVSSPKMGLTLSPNHYENLNSFRESTIVPDPWVTRPFLIRLWVDTTCYNVDSSLLNFISRLPPYQ